MSAFIIILGLVALAFITGFVCAMALGEDARIELRRKNEELSDERDHWELTANECIAEMRDAYNEKRGAS